LPYPAFRMVNAELGGGKPSPYTLCNSITTEGQASCLPSARAPTRGAPTLLGSAAMYTEGTASRPPTAKGLADIGVRENEIGTCEVAQGTHSGPFAMLRAGSAAFRATRVLAAPPMRQSEFCWAAPPKPRRGRNAARLKCEPCATCSLASLAGQRVATVGAFMTVGSSFDDEPTIGKLLSLPPPRHFFLRAAPASVL